MTKHKQFSPKPQQTRDDDKSEARESYRAQLKKLYTEYNPKKLVNIDWLLHKYAGDEDTLIEAVQAKYEKGAQWMPKKEIGNEKFIDEK